MVGIRGIQINPPCDAEGFLLAASEAMKGAKSLSTCSSQTQYAVTLLCGHACETTLKSLLSLVGYSKDVLRDRPFGHNLVYLWSATADSGYELPEARPEWLERLNHAHANPDRLRYPLGIQGMVFPAQGEMISGVHKLLKYATTLYKCDQDA